MKLIAVLVLSHHSKANMEEECIIMCRSNTSQFCYGKLLCLNTLRSKATPSLQLLKKNVNAFHVTEIILIPSFILPRPVTVTLSLVPKIHTKLYLRWTAPLSKSGWASNKFRGRLPLPFHQYYATPQFCWCTKEITEQYAVCMSRCHLSVMFD